MSSFEFNPNAREFVPGAPLPTDAMLVEMERDMDAIDAMLDAEEADALAKDAAALAEEADAMLADYEANRAMAEAEAEADEAEADEADEADEAEAVEAVELVPNCRFDTRCNRRNCPNNHPNGRAIDVRITPSEVVSRANRFFNTDNTVAEPNPAVNALFSQAVVERATAFFNPPVRNTRPCRYGVACYGRRSGACPFQH